MTDIEKANDLAQYYSEESDYKRTVGYDCAIEMADWKEQQMIDKACEWLGKNIGNYQNWEYNEFHQCVEYDGSFDIEKMISDFRKAMKGGEE